MGDDYSEVSYEGIYMLPKEIGTSLLSVTMGDHYTNRQFLLDCKFEFEDE